MFIIGESFVNRFESDAILFQDFDNKELENKLEWASHWIIALFSSVEGRVQLAQDDVDIGPGDMVVIPPATPFLFSARDSVHQSISSSGSVVSFVPRCLPPALGRLSESESVFSFIDSIPKGTVGRPNDQERCLNRLRSVKQARGMLRIARLYALLELIAREVTWKRIAKNQNTNDLTLRDSARIMAVKRYAENRLNSNLSRAEVAAHIGMDPSAFSRFFKRSTGMRFVDYLATLRVQAAARLITSNRSIPIDEVAKRCGFRNQSVFNNQFKRRLGTTPRQYRKNVDIEPLTP